MGTCNFCGKESELISSVLKICRKCILEKDWNKVYEHLKLVHTSVRQEANLPSLPPKTSKVNLKYECNLCINNCLLSEKDVSYCGLRNMIKDQDGSLPFPTKSLGYMYGYLDRNPTNCCNAWFCPAGTKNGYPEYSDFNGPEYGTYSYAAFLYG
ncbi:MAG: radical SAM protein, partial [Promethearchaeia archaeon]